MKKIMYACIYILAITTITSLTPLYLTAGYITRKVKV